MGYVSVVYFTATVAGTISSFNKNEYKENLPKLAGNDVKPEDITLTLASASVHVALPVVEPCRDSLTIPPKSIGQLAALHFLWSWRDRQVPFGTAVLAGSLC